MFFFKVLLFIIVLLSLSLLFLRNAYYLLFTMLLIFTLWAILFFYFSDFISLLIILVYSGGIAVLFLFASFVIDVNFFLNSTNTKSNVLNLVILSLIGLKFILLFLQTDISTYFLINSFDLSFFSYKIKIFSKMLYKDYPILLVFVALILLVAMIGSVGVFRQKALKPFSKYS